MLVAISNSDDLGHEHWVCECARRLWMVLAKKCPIVDNLTVFLTLTAQTFPAGEMGKIPKGVVRAKILGERGGKKKGKTQNQPPTL